MTADRPRRITPLQSLTANAGMIDQFLYPLAGLADMGEPATDFTDAMVHYIAETQQPSGEWDLPASRPPLQESNVTRTMLAISALKTYGWPARQSEFDERIARARTWLAKTHAWTTVDEADRILGLSIAGASSADLQEAGRQLIAQQRSDGGWARTRYLDSDAFGTASVLNALRRAGLVQVTDAVYRRGTVPPRHSVSGWIVVCPKPGCEASAIFPERISVRSRSMDLELGHGLCGHGLGSGRGEHLIQSFVLTDIYIK